MATKSLTKAALLEELATTIGVGKREASAFLDALLAIVYRETKKKGEFTLPGLGKLVKTKRKARKGINPKTGESIRIAASTAVKLRVAKAAKDAIIGAKTPAVATPSKKSASTPKAEGKAKPVKTGSTKGTKR